MTNILPIVETFLLAEVSLSLSNIRAHLNWAAASSPSASEHAVEISKDSVSRISMQLLHVERRAFELAEAMSAQQASPYGLHRALHDVAHKQVA